jgi:hypothetical protein
MVQNEEIIMENREALLKAIKEATVERDGREILACAKAFQIAKKFSIGVREVGDLCNEEGIKIAHCQLGCF